MTAHELFLRALDMLGYVEPNGHFDDTLQKKALSAVNAIYADLYYLLNDSGFVPAKKLTDTINLPERVLYDVACYGVAMHLSLLEADSLNEQIFATLYNSKRISVSNSDKIYDCIVSPVLEV